MDPPGMAALFAILSGFMVLPQASRRHHKQAVNVPELSQFPAATIGSQSHQILNMLKNVLIM
jgi:hypothetical protein